MICAELLFPLRIIVGVPEEGSGWWGKGLVQLRRRLWAFKPLHRNDLILIPATVSPASIPAVTPAEMVLWKEQPGGSLIVEVKAGEIGS